jgi:WD40 repeat protein
MDFGLGGLIFNPTLLDSLRNHPSLQSIEDIPVAAFWSGWDRRKEPTKLPEARRVITTMSRDVRGLAFDRESNLLATSGSDGKVQVWDLKSGDRLRLFEIKSIGNGVAFVPNTDLLAASYTDSIRFWNLKTGRQEGERIPSPGLFQGLAVSPAGDMIVANSDGRRPIARYSIPKRQPLPPLDGHTGVVSFSSFSHSGKHLATAASWPDCSVRLWETAAAREVFRQDRGAFDFSVDVGFSPDDRLLLVGSSRSHIELIDWKAGKTEKSFHWFPAASLAFGPEGKHLLIGGQTGILTVMDAGSGEVLVEANGAARITRIAVSPNGKIIATAHQDGNVRLWDWAKLGGDR